MSVRPTQLLCWGFVIRLVRKCHFACRHAKNFIIFQSMDQKFAWGHAKSHESRAKYLAQGRTNTDGRFNSGLLWNYGGRNSSPCDSSSHALPPVMRFLQSCGSSSITLSRFAAEPWSRTPPTSHLCSSSIYINMESVVNFW